MKLDNIIKHCERVAKDYKETPISNSETKRLESINQGWLEALKFVRNNYIILTPRKAEMGG